MTVTAGSTAGAISISAGVSGMPTVVFNLSSRLPGPVINATSFVNFASNEPGLAPGNLVRIVGAGLAPAISGTVGAELLDAQLPYTLAGVTVELRSGGASFYAPIYRVTNDGSSQSVVIQVPYELPIGYADAVVSVSGGNTSVTGIPVRTLSPGVLEEVISGRRAAVVIRSDGLPVSPLLPARRGETVRMYVIGLGQTTPQANTNRVGVPDQNVLATVTVGLDGSGITPLAVQVAENLIGVYEITFKIPNDAAIGSDRALGLVVASSPDQPFWSNGSLISISQ